MNIVEKSTTGGLHTGLVLCNVIAINPDVNGIRKIYNKAEDAEVREPNYDMGDKGYRIDVYLRAVKENIILKLNFFLKDEVVTSQSGKFLFTNDHGQSFYYESLEDIEKQNAAKAEEWQKFSLDGAQKAKGGEVELKNFIIALLRANPMKSVIRFENYSKIANGNIAELRSIIEDAAEKGSVVYVLCGVKDEKYQDVFGKAFLPYGFTNGAEKKFWKDAENGFKRYYTQGGLTPYTPLEAPAFMEKEEDGNPFEDSKPKLF